MKIAVMGYGTIGSGVVEVLEINKDKIAERAGEPIEVKYVLDLREFPGTSIENKIVHDYKTIAQDPEIGIVVETMGGVEPAFTFVKEMLEAGKQVATSNKNLVAAKGAELIRIARDHGVNFQFEASVGGGIPIIRPLNKCLTAEEIEEITGIESRATVLGHVQRGGNPTVRDRVVATQMGFAAVELLREGKGNRVIGMQKGEIVDFDIYEALNMKKPFDDDMYEIAHITSI